MIIVDFPPEKSIEELQVFFEGCTIQHIHEIAYRGEHGIVKAIRYYYIAEAVKELKKVTKKGDK